MLHRIIFFLICIFCVVTCQQKKTPNFSEDIAPIIQQKCLKCHQQNGGGPFALSNYEEIASKGQLIAHVVQHKIMPPWPADPEYTHFIGELALTNQEIETIQEWVKQGMPHGDSSIQLVLPNQKKEENSNYILVKAPKPFFIKGDNKDHFFVAKYPIQVPANTYIEAIEFVPHQVKLVHHMNAHLINYAESKTSNPFKAPFWVDQNQQESQRIHQALNLCYEDGSYPVLTPSVCNYLPGSQFSKYPNGIGGFSLAKKAVLYVNDIHFGPSPIDVTDSSYFKIYLTNKAPVRPVSEFQIGTLGLSPVVPNLSVPPNCIKTFNIEFTVPEDISILSIVPHMHLIGKKFKSYAIKPSGDTVRLVAIHDWDFRWQYFYRPPHLLKLPRGSKIYVEAMYDNTAQNPNNPFSPPQTISDRNGSMKTTDEMLQLILTYVPYKLGDEDISNE